MSLEKAILVNTVTDERIPVMFNPEQYTLNRGVNYAQTAIPGLSAPVLQFVGGTAQTLEMELLVDTYESHASVGGPASEPGDDVRVWTRAITDLMEIDPSTHAPPELLFVWASLRFSCVLVRASQRFVLFRADGTPVRARLQVTFHECRDLDVEAKQIKRETADYTKTHHVAEGETLRAIAWREYGDVAAWRAIALANQLDDPRQLSTGQRLVLPRLPFVDPSSGEPVR